jgi:hypothetical protein
MTDNVIPYTPDLYRGQEVIAMYSLIGIEQGHKYRVVFVDLNGFIQLERFREDSNEWTMIPRSYAPTWFRPWNED